ncbi:MAG TPA: acyl transferase [Chitinophagaceae bacterium]|nr:acyl transferase [Chitinophagaceae bacterium]HMZ46894.1 acyl transferase [Chitinophagaceae bacterium]HNN31763.1 acyl transferase [Chitinophagaceae bacterium]
MNKLCIDNILKINNEDSFKALALESFHFQFNQNLIYNKWCNLIGVKPSNVSSIHQIPFLPISFFKTHSITTTNFEPTTIFESSKTTGNISSKHLIKDLAWYENSFNACFNQSYGNVEDYCILGLLPSYLERGNSSLVYMVEHFIKKSKHQLSGFYLHNYNQLNIVLQQLEDEKIPTILIGVTFALLDFAEAFPMPLNHTTILETGGMKGRKKEILRTEVHSILKNAFQTKNIHSEYGMTELLSQAYSTQNGIFNCPNWMKVIVRNEDDPMQIQQSGKGVLNIIDLANKYSCSFIATDDAAIVNDNGSFEIQGRVDNSDIRGCSLLLL